MKVKQDPSDFQVEELIDACPSAHGDFAFYRLDKIGWTTPDALQAVRRRWQIDLQRVSYGGLKDRHAETTQYFTIFRGPNQNLSHHQVTITYLGQCSEPFTSQQILGNHFRITLRDFTESGVSKAIQALSEVQQTGLPNYFDDQRFGSVGDDHSFIAREMVHGRFEQALKLALAERYEFDNAEQKREKALLTEHWGDWVFLKANLSKGHARSLVDYLVSHPTDFKGAVARLRPDLGGLYLSAYQSYLWNRMLDRWLRANFDPSALAVISLKVGDMAVPLRMKGPTWVGWYQLALPLPSARLRPEPGAPWLPIVEQVLADEGLTLQTLKIPGLQKPFFSKGERAGCVRPQAVTSEVGHDERNRGRRKLIMAFDLPRGSYATILIKRITAIRVDGST